MSSGPHERLPFRKEIGVIVSYYHSFPNAFANILWDKKYPMNAGKFPKDHPCAGTGTFELEMGNCPQLVSFRERGYWCSCFPEGDGIVLDTKGNDAETVAKDIRESFGWEVKILRR